VSHGTLPDTPTDALTGKQLAAIVALLDAPTIKAAASRCGVGVASLFRWIKRPAFRQALDQARREFLREGAALAACRQAGVSPQTDEGHRLPPNAAEPTTPGPAARCHPPPE
jgi:hypothetical protein